MSQRLKKDICDMHAPGSPVSQVKSIEKCLLPEVQYACLTEFSIYKGVVFKLAMAKELISFYKLIYYIGLGRLAG
jgi:hypothetical protein